MTTTRLKKLASLLTATGFCFVRTHRTSSSAHRTSAGMRRCLITDLSQPHFLHGSSRLTPLFVSRSLRSPRPSSFSIDNSSCILHTDTFNVYKPMSMHCLFLTYYFFSHARKILSRITQRSAADCVCSPSCHASTIRSATRLAFWAGTKCSFTCSQKSTVHRSSRAKACNGS